MISRVIKIIDTAANENKKELEESNNPRLFLQDCKFIGNKKISIANEVITADKILLHQVLTKGLQYFIIILSCWVMVNVYHHFKITCISKSIVILYKNKAIFISIFSVIV